MTAALPDWVTNTPSAPIHEPPAGSELQRPFTQAQLLEIGARWLEGFIKEVVKALIGAVIPGTPAFEQLQDWANNLDIAAGVQALKDKLTGIVDATPNDIDNWLLDLLTGDSALNPAQLQANLWPLGIFPEGSVAGSGVWVHDPAVSRTVDGTGSVKVTADGTKKALKGVTTAVVAGQEVSPSVFVKWQDYVGTTAPIQLNIKQYHKVGTVETFVSTVTVTSFGPTTGAGGWAELTGTYTTPADGSVNLIRGQLMVTANATGGTIWFDDAAARLKLLQDWVAQLPESLQEQIARIQAVVNTITNALTNGTSLVNTLEDLLEALHIIPPDNVQGAAGPATIFDSIFGIINAFLGGAVGAPGSTGGSLADVTNVAGQVSSNAALGAYAWQIANIINNTPVARGFLPTGRANYDITSANTFLPSTQADALSASFGLLQAMPIGVVSWYGYGTSGITEFYVNIRKVNLATGVRTLVHHSANVVGNLQSGTTDADADFMFYELPTPISGGATDYFYPEFVPVGGTHYIRGMSFADNIKDHPLSNVPCYGTTVDYTSSPNSPTTDLAKAVGEPDVPWIELAVSLAGAADHREPEVRTLDNDGETIPIPSWCNRLDLIPLAGGGEGADGFGPGLNGRPGQPGSFAPITFERGTQWDDDSTLVTFNVLTGGDAKLSIPGYDTTASAGADGSGQQFGLIPVGNGPGILTYNGQTYTGGVDQKAWGGRGADPGGGGNGGRGLTFQSGGAGGRPIGWVCFRQVEVDGEETGGDTTPPDMDSATATVSTTPTAFTLTNINGAVDDNFAGYEIELD